MTQIELAKVLRVHQPDVSNLLRGKLNLFSITKLCQYADRLKLKVRIEVEKTQRERMPLKRIMEPDRRRTAHKSVKASQVSVAQFSKATRQRAVA
jgi:transcriptional regulator with XRE-family HTH domain